MSMPAKPDLALIGGTGLYDWPGLEDVSEHAPHTPWGEPSDAIRIGRWQGLTLAFLARHGRAHRIAPHEVNYRANLWALQGLGAQQVLAINTVGGISAGCAPGVLVLPDQLIDYSWGRPGSFHDGRGPVPHAEFAEPFSPELRQRIIAAAQASGTRLQVGGCYGVTQGPRLETRAEIARLRRDGCDLVGMTLMPEAALARELGMAYASLAPVGNWAAGCGDDAPITLQAVAANVHGALQALPALLAQVAAA